MIPHLDFLSFWIGVVTGALLLWFLSGFSEIWPRVNQFFSTNKSNIREISAAGTEDRLRKDALQRAQSSHLAAPIFSLDEIMIQPTLLAPPPQVTPGSSICVDDVVSDSIAYLPDWPELASRYGGACIDVIEPLKQIGKFALMGQPGCGKTTTLAYLASAIARRETHVKELDACLPIFLHINEITLPLKPENDPANLISEAVSSGLTGLLNSQTAGLIRNSFNSGNLVLLLDGLDELPTSDLKDGVSFLQALLKRYPSIRVVIPISPDYWDGISSLGLPIFSLAAWTQAQCSDFIANWRTQWDKLVNQPESEHSSRNVETLLLMVWLSNENTFRSPLEWTLLIWAAFNGDTRGSSLADTLEAYILRRVPVRSRPGLEKLATQIVHSGQIALSWDDANSLINRNRKTSVSSSTTEPGSTSTENPSETPRPATTQPVDLENLVKNGVLLRRSDGSISITHPVVMGYLAACAISSDESLLNDVVSQQTWLGKTVCLHLLASMQDISMIVDSSITESEEPLYRSLFWVSRWLKDTPVSTPWHSTAMRNLVGVLNNDNLPNSIRQRALSALLVSGDPNLGTLFHQLIAPDSPQMCTLAVLGCGVLQDPKFNADLAALLTNSAPNIRNAACLALIALNNRTATESVARILLQGDENSRRSAAEALANDPQEGYAVLKEGSIMGDILLRRAVVYGLSRIKEKWSLDILEKIRIEDSQWVVRNAANQAVDALQRANPYIPHPIPTPSHSPWLVAFAARQGMGIPEGSAAVDILLLALKVGNEEEQFASLEYLRQTPDPKVIAGLFDAVYSGLATVREASVAVLWELASRGISLPSTATYRLSAEPLIPSFGDN